MKKILFFFLFAVILFLPAFALVHAAGTGLGAAMDNLGKSTAGTGLKGGGADDLANYIGTVIKAVLSLVGTIFLILTIYAGILWMTASGAEEKIKKARSILTSSIIGLIIVMAAYAITFFVTTKLGGTGGTTGGGVPAGNGSQVCCYCAGAAGSCGKLNYTCESSISDESLCRQIAPEYFMAPACNQCLKM
jgi:hypothetical protein